MAKRFYLRYNTYSAPPSANDLQPVRDNTNPNRIQEGNPDLKPNYQHQLNFNGNVWQAMSGRYFWSGGNATFTQNAFANSTYFDALGRTVSKTVNVDGNMFATVYAGGGYPILNRKITFEPSLNATYIKSNNFINGLKNTTQTTTVNGAFSIELSVDSLEMVSAYSTSSFVAKYIFGMEVKTDYKMIYNRLSFFSIYPTFSGLIFSFIFKDYLGKKLKFGFKIFYLYFIFLIYMLELM
jgi:hypothetical protein